MDLETPAGPAKPDHGQTHRSGAGAVPSGDDQVLVLSPGVTLTLGKDALILSGRSP